MRRVNESILQTLSEALPSLKDPRIVSSRSRVRTTPDLHQARVFVSVLGPKKKIARTIEALNAAHGVLQATLTRVENEANSQLTFEYDPIAEEALANVKLIDELVLRMTTTES